MKNRDHLTFFALTNKYPSTKQKRQKQSMSIEFFVSGNPDFNKSFTQRIKFISYKTTYRCDFFKSHVHTTKTIIPKGLKLD
jgi:hypothetical protein